MNLTIWKYAYSITDQFTLSMPVGARILTTQIQNDVPVLWAFVDPSAEKEIRTFRVFGTGNPVDTKGDLIYHIGTVQNTHGGSLVWHLFESKRFNP